MAANQRWSEMGPGQRAAVLIVGSVELALTVTALVDLIRRPADQVRGDKRLWALGVLVQPVGPIAYLAWGARGDST
jgi:hypothetical protein